MTLPKKYLHLAAEIENFFKVDIKVDPSLLFEEIVYQQSIEVLIFRKILCRSESEPKFLGWRFLLDKSSLIIKEMGADLKMEAEAKVTDLGPISQQRVSELIIFWKDFKANNPDVLKGISFNEERHLVEIVDQKVSARVRIWTGVLGDLIYDAWVEFSSSKITTNTYKIVH